MSKFRRNNSFYSPRNRSKTNQDDIRDISPNGKLKLSKNKLMSHGEFLNRIQKSLYYNGRRSKMSIPLSDYIAESFSETHNGYSLNRLNYSTVGKLNATPCSLILALVYLDRLKDADPSYTKHVTPTELFLVSMMVATKFYSGHDEETPYIDWTECINTTSDDLIHKELRFLNAIDWKVYVSNEEFFEKVKSLEKTLARRQGCNRGFFTYSELSNVMPSVQIAKQFIQSTLVLGISYTVFVATMIAGVFIASQIPGTYLNSSSRTVPTQSTIQQDFRELETSNHESRESFIMTAADLTKNENKFNYSDLSLTWNTENRRLADISGESDEQNTIFWISGLSSWCSPSNSDAPKWPVINFNTNKESFCDVGGCNSSFQSNHLSPNRIELSVHDFKLKWF